MKATTNFKVIKDYVDDQEQVNITIKSAIPARLMDTLREYGVEEMDYCNVNISTGELIAVFEVSHCFKEIQ